MSIELLTEIERSIQIRMPKGGTFEDRNDFLISNGIYKEYQSVFEKYSELGVSGDLEALKRSLFFLWYQCSEPNQLSGLDELNEALTEKVLARIDRIAEENHLDEELEFMLPYYYQVCEWYFDRFNNLNSLSIASKANADMWVQNAPKHKWANRGIMGEYWSSKGS